MADDNVVDIFTREIVQPPAAEIAPPASYMETFFVQEYLDLLGLVHAIGEAESEQEFASYHHDLIEKVRAYPSSID